MSIYQVGTHTFSVYGDGTTTVWSVDLSQYFTGISGFTLINAWITTQQSVTVGGSTTTYSVATDLPSLMTGNILTVTLPNAPIGYLEPYVGPNATPVSFTVAIRY